MSRNTGWLARRQAVVKKRRDQWLKPNLQRGEELMVIEGIDAVATADSRSNLDLIWPGAFLVLLFVSNLVHGAVRLTLVVLALLLVVPPLMRAQQYYVAVTDRRLLLQPLSFWKARPLGALEHHPLKDVTLVRFKASRPGWNSHPRMTIDIVELSRPRKMILQFPQSPRDPSSAEAVEK